MTFLVHISILTLSLKLWLEAAKANLSLFPTVSHFFFFNLILTKMVWMAVHVFRQGFFCLGSCQTPLHAEVSACTGKKMRMSPCFRGENVTLCWCQAGSSVPALPPQGPWCSPSVGTLEMFCSVCEHWCCHSTQPSGLLRRTQCLNTLICFVSDGTLLKH